VVRASCFPILFIKVSAKNVEGGLKSTSSSESGRNKKARRQEGEGKRSLMSDGRASFGRYKVFFRGCWELEKTFGAAWTRGNSKRSRRTGRRAGKRSGRETTRGEIWGLPGYVGGEGGNSENGQKKTPIRSSSLRFPCLTTANAI